MAFQANVGIAITEGFITKPHKTKTAVAILKAAKEDHKLLRKMMRGADPTLPEGHPGSRPSGPHADWMDFASVEDEKGKKKQDIIPKHQFFAKTQIAFDADEDGAPHLP